MKDDPIAQSFDDHVDLLIFLQRQMCIRHDALPVQINDQFTAAEMVKHLYPRGFAVLSLYRA